MVEQLKQARRLARYFIVRSVVRLIQDQPVTVLPRLERLLLTLLLPFFGREIRRAKELLPAEFADRSEKIVAEMMRNQVRNLLEIFLYEKLVAADPQYITFSGREHLEEAVSRGKGFIILTGHFGNWELIAYHLVGLGYPLHAMARAQAISRMTEFMNGFREKRGVAVVMKDSLSASLKLLQEGTPIGMLSDLNAREWGFQVPFFGRTASFYVSPVILSQRSGAPLLPTFIERDGSGRHQMRVEAPITWNRHETMGEKVRKYVERYEAAFRRRPDHWVWFHERYRHAELGRAA